MLEQLKERGWYITDDGLKILERGITNVSVDQIIAVALNTDIKEFGAPALPPDSVKGKSAQVTVDCVLQIQKVRNILSPKVSEEKDRGSQLLRVSLTDGYCTFVGLDISGASTGLSVNTMPGTKIRLRGNVGSERGFLLLNKGIFQILGGRVEPLIEKWKITRETVGKYRDRGGTDGPKWVPFGRKVEGREGLVAGAKAPKHNSDASQGEDASVVPSEFEEARQNTIAEVQAQGTASARKYQTAKAQVQQRISSATTSTEHSSRQSTSSLLTSSHQGSSSSQLASGGDSRKTGPAGDAATKGQSAAQKRLNTKDFRRLDRFDIFADADYEKAPSGADKPSQNFSLFDFVSQKVSNLKMDEGKQDGSVDSRLESAPNTKRGGYSEQQHSRNRGNDRRSDYNDYYGSGNGTNRQQERYATGASSQSRGSASNRSNRSGNQRGQSGRSKGSNYPEYSSKDERRNFDYSINSAGGLANFPSLTADEPQYTKTGQVQKSQPHGANENSRSKPEPLFGPSSMSSDVRSGSSTRGTYRNNSGYSRISPRATGDPAGHQNIISAIETSNDHRGNDDRTFTDVSRPAPPLMNQHIPPPAESQKSRPLMATTNPMGSAAQFSTNVMPPTNLPPPNLNVPPPPKLWHPGTRCFARHPANGRFCEASVVAPAPDHCVVFLHDFRENIRVTYEDIVPLQHQLPGIPLY